MYLKSKRLAEKKRKKNQSPKGIIWSAVPLPCFFAVLKSQRVAGQRPREGTKSCRMGRNSVRPSIRTSVLPPLAGPHTLLACPQTPPAGPQTLLAGPQTLRARLRGLRACWRGLRACWRGLRACWRGLRAGWRGLRASQQGLRASWRGLGASQHGLRASQRGAGGRMDGRADGRTDGISPHSTGLCPLSGPLPKNQSPTDII